MRKTAYLFLVCFCCMILYGCGNDQTLSDETNDLIAEYAANRVLQNNPDYKDRLITEAPVTTEITEEQTTTNETTTQETLEDADSQNGDSDTSTDQSVEEEAQPETTEAVYVTDVSGLYKESGLGVIYKGFKLAKKYSDGVTASADVEPVDGGQLCIITLDVKNTSGKDQTVDLLDLNYIYSLRTETGLYDPLFTICNDDFSVYQSDMKKDETKKAVLIFEVPKSESKDSERVLNITYRTKTESISVK